MLLIALMTLASAAGTARAEVARITYYVVPAIGPLTVVAGQPVTGATIEHAPREVIGHSDDIDDVIFATVEQVIGKSRSPRPTVNRVRLNGELFPQASSDADKTAIATLQQALRDKTSEAGAHVVIVVAPYRAPALMRIQNGRLTGAHVQGAGYYVDRMTRLRPSGMAGGARGYLGVFANLRLIAFDASSGTVLRETTLVDGMTLSAARSPDIEDPWQAATNEEKSRLLRILVARVIRDALPAVLQPAADASR